MLAMAFMNHLWPTNPTVLQVAGLAVMAHKLTSEAYRAVGSDFDLEILGPNAPSRDQVISEAQRIQRFLRGGLWQ